MPKVKDSTLNKFKKADIEKLGPVEQTERLSIRTPFFRAFHNLRHLFESGDATIKGDVTKTLQKVIASLEAKSGKDDLKKIVKVLKPSLIQGLSHSNYDIRRNALNAISEIGAKGYKLDDLLPEIAKHLKDDASWVATVAASVLVNLAILKWNLTPIISEINEAISGELEGVRPYVSRALSIHLINIKEEEPLGINEKVKSLPGFWDFGVSHRRTYAKNDNPLNFKTDISFHICGVCGSNQLDFIYYDEDVGNVWKYIKYEYRCKDCGKYTIYEIND